MKHVAGILLLQVLLAIDGCSATNAAAPERGSQRGDDTMRTNALARLLLAGFASGESTTATTRQQRLRRTLGDNDNNDNDNAFRREFGPGADWSCTGGGSDTTTAPRDNHDACTLTEGCSWCPLGSTLGVCLRSAQASWINALKNDHLLHLRCYTDNTEDLIDDTATGFWDEAVACHGHTGADCAGDHDGGGHACSWCTFDKLGAGACLSTSLWDNLVVAQALEEFDEDVSTADRIRLDRVVHCVHGGGDGDESEAATESLWSHGCGWAVAETDEDAAACLGAGCVVQANPFPGLLGSKAGKHCVSRQQQQAIRWAIKVLWDTGWVDEMGAFVR